VYESPEDPKWLDDWSPDGRFLLFNAPQSGNLFALPLAGDRKPVQLAHSLTRIDAAHFSPDSKWVSYATDETGQFETWVAPFPAFDNRRQVTARGGGQARWRADMKELFYLTTTGQMMSVAIAPDPKTGGLEFMAPVLLFQSPLANPNLGIDQYDVTHDGKRFLFIKPKQDQAATVSPITVVVNWTVALGTPAAK
jgi:eukaryotic-like serine/threonine-protein kinase